MLEVDQCVGPKRGQEGVVHQVVGILPRRADDRRVAEEMRVELPQKLFVVAVGHVIGVPRDQLPHIISETRPREFVTIVGPGPKVRTR